MRTLPAAGFAMLIAALLTSACTSESVADDENAVTSSKVSEVEVHVGAIQGTNGSTQQGRYRLGVSDPADSVQSAAFFARAAALAYKSAGDPSLDESIAELGLEQYFFFDAKFKKDPVVDSQSVPDAQGFVGLVTTRDAAGGKAVVISYRGTDSRKDALTDVWVTKTPSDEYGAGEGIEVHSGFKEQTKILWDAIEAQVWKLVMKPASMRKNDADAFWPVYLTGHSLGGAVAVLAAARVVSPKSADEVASLSRRFGAPAPANGAGYPIGGVFTFGQPRVGNSAFVDALKRRLESTRHFRPDGIPYVRYYNGRDVVGRIPTIGYEHGGLELWLRDEAVECSAWQDRSRIGYAIADHYMKSYIDATDKAIAGANASGRDRLCGS